MHVWHIYLKRRPRLGWPRGTETYLEAFLVSKRRSLLRGYLGEVRADTRDEALESSRSWWLEPKWLYLATERVADQRLSLVPDNMVKVTCHRESHIFVWCGPPLKVNVARESIQGWLSGMREEGTFEKVWVLQEVLAQLKRERAALAGRTLRDSLGSYQLSVFEWRELRIGSQS